MLEAKLELLAEPVICRDIKNKILSTIISMLDAERRNRTLARAKYASNIRSVWPHLWQIVLRDFYHE